MTGKRQKSGVLPLIVCIVLFACALGGYFLFGDETPQTGEPADKGGVMITEVMSNNRTYPDRNGKVLDYVEITNLTGKSVDISNYKISDDEISIGYTFPQGTVLKPYGSVVCWCDRQGSEGYGTFGISKDGGEIIYLYNSANVIIDEQTVPALVENQPYIRNEDGSWTTGGPASPGFPNTQEGNTQWLASMGYQAPDVVFSEVQTSARYTWLDEDRTVSDWIELYNAGTKAAVLDGAYLSDDPADPLKWQIPSLTIEPGAYALIRCGGSGGMDANFSLPSGGGTFVLTGPYGNVISQLDCPALERDTTWSLGSDGTYAVATKQTPGFENSDEGYAQWLLSVGAPSYPVVINEIQTSNRSAILDSQGRLSDWIELYNPGKEPVVMDGAFLSDDPLDPFKWQIRDLTVAPGAYVVIPCTGKGGSESEASFAMPRSGCTVVLSGPAGNRILEVEVPAMAEDRSWQRMTDGAYIETASVSPGLPNTEEGNAEFRVSQRVIGALAISEVMPSNSRFMAQKDGEYYDWVELKNVSESMMDLSEYAISDSSSDLLLFSLPKQTLAPGETVIVICSGNTELDNRYIHAPFTLNRDECWVYVTHKEAGISDYIRVAGVPVMGSAGRMDGEGGVFYFGTPTPGKDNVDGVVEIASDPFVETPDGIYNDINTLGVVLSGEGQIYYTLDGSEPTMNSLLYTEPLLLTKTTVIRARCYAEGKLPSRVVTASYIINENHTLPVISITAKPSDIFGGYGIYTKYTREMEIPCNLTLYEGDGGFSIDCGLEMYGHTNLEMKKKSFKVNFRGCYGASTLNYPVYGEDGPYVYDALCIRAGQDYPQSIFRDELFTSLCRQMTDNVLAQRDKFCILYINGEYFGIYCMKEAFNEMFYAQNRDVRKESVEIVQAPVDYETEMHEFMRFLGKSNMKDEKVYEYACSVFNVDSVIDWMIIQGYTANGDVQQNLRYFRSTDNGNRFEMAFYDLDWAFYNRMPFTDVLSSDRGSWQHLRITINLMENPTFRKQFLERLSYHMEHTLSNENVLARIDYYQNLLAPEVPREREKWGDNYKNWIKNIDIIRNYITKRNHQKEMINRLVRYIGLTQNEIDTYFWRWK